MGGDNIQSSKASVKLIRNRNSNRSCTVEPSKQELKKYTSRNNTIVCVCVTRKFVLSFSVFGFAFSVLYALPPNPNPDFSIGSLLSFCLCVFSWFTPPIRVLPSFPSFPLPLLYYPLPRLGSTLPSEPSVALTMWSPRRKYD